MAWSSGRHLGVVCLQGLSAFEVDAAMLANLAPGLVLTQNACATCDADADGVRAALQRAGLAGPNAHAPAVVMTLAPRTLAAALDTVLQARPPNRTLRSCPVALRSASLSPAPLPVAVDVRLLQVESGIPKCQSSCRAKVP